MTSVEKITPERFPELFDAFLREDDPDVDESLWRQLFTLPESCDEDYCGYALVDGARVVGMLGTLFSTRTISGRREHFCNLHNWNVHPDFRGKSLLLMRPILRMQDHTLTDFTPTEAVCTLSKRLGFQTLDSSVRVLLPMGRGKAQSHRSETTINDDKDQIRPLLSEQNVRILDDHQNDALRHLLVTRGNDSCYIVYSRNDRHWMPYAHIHYISNLNLFANCQGIIRSHLIGPEGRRFATVDQRRLGNTTLPRSFRSPLRSRQLFRSSSLSEMQIDSLYSELCILNLTTFADLSSGMRDFLSSSLIGRYILGIGQGIRISSENPISEVGATR